MPKNNSERNRRNLDNFILNSSGDESLFSLYAESDGPGQAEDEAAEVPISVPSPREIKAYLDRYVIGQEQAKKVLAVAAYNHVKRINDGSGLIRKSNVLMVGPSGCGKTLLAETLAKLLELPMVTVDATSLTESGYSGNCVETILTRLYLQAGERKSLAERGIIFVDEIDKLACRGQNLQREAYCRGVQQGLLKIVEGGKISAPVSLETKNRRTVIDTKNILFICGGAFAGLDELEEEDEPFPEPPRRIGFTADFNEPPARGTEAPSARGRLSPDLLVRYGLTQEFVGRLPVLIRLDPLGVEDMVRIISQTDTCLVKEYQQLLAKDGVKLRFSPEALKAMAELALERNIGARGLRAMMEELLTDLMFEAPDGDWKGKKYTVREIP